MSRSGIIIILLLLIIEFFIVKNYYSVDEGNIITKIDELETEISNLNIKKDSIVFILDTIETKIVTNNNYYEKQVKDIIAQPIDSNSVYVGQYLRRFCKSNGFIMQ
jgi:hypothetical protein